MECLKCKHIWTPRIDKPKRCPGCGQRRYDRPRVYTEHIPINNSTPKFITADKIEKVIEKVNESDKKSTEWY